MQLVDVHCHLESLELSPRLDALLEGARLAGVRKFITAAVHPTQWAASAALARQYEVIEFAAGVHPWYCDNVAIEALPRLDAAVQDAVAVGEIGLDAKTEKFTIERQTACFVPQLKTAQRLALPVILHCRGAFNTLLALFKKHGPPPGGIIHNFSGSPELADQCIACGLDFSMGGVLTWRNSAKRRRLLRHIYPDHFLLETDAPDITPVEARGQTNTPANILYNLRAAAEILDASPEEVAVVATRNAQRIFGIKL